MDITGSIADRVRTAAILLTGVIPLALQPGPVAGEAVAARHVDRLLDERPEGEAELPDDVELQCRLISLISDAVTLRAFEVSGQPAPRPVPKAPPVWSALNWIGADLQRRHSRIILDEPVVRPRSVRSPEQPRGP